MTLGSSLLNAPLLFAMGSAICTNASITLKKYVEQDRNPGLRQDSNKRLAADCTSALLRSSLRAFAMKPRLLFKSLPS